MTRLILDARKDQLNILKLERRFLRPMATAILDQRATRSVKIAAIAATAAFLGAMHSAPSKYVDNLGIGENNSAHYSNMCESCSDLKLLVENKASKNEIDHALKNLFETVDIAHNYWENLAGSVGAKLLKVDDVEEKEIGSGGGNKSNISWLSHLKI